MMLNLRDVIKALDIKIAKKYYFFRIGLFKNFLTYLEIKKESLLLTKMA